MKSAAIRLLVGLSILAVFAFNVRFDGSWGGNFLFGCALVYGTVWGVIHWAAARAPKWVHHTLFLLLALPPALLWPYMFLVAGLIIRSFGNNLALAVMFMLASLVPAYVGYAHATSRKQ